ncbi:MAG: PP2C family protein-serine/threonine phosphatase [bacterium]
MARHAAPARAKVQRPSLAYRFRCFWRNLSDGLTLQQIWSDFRRETRASYRLYAAEMEGRFERVPARKRWISLGRALFWAMLGKLSPPRRICLFVAVVLAAWGVGVERMAAVAAGALVVLAVLGLELADRVAMKRDLEIARDIQSRLVPRTPPTVPGVDIAFATRPANTVAGDYYDAFLTPMPEGRPGERLLVVVADVAGKSVPAALLMATFQSCLHTLLQEALPLSRLIERLNRYCCDHSLEGLRFTTAFFGELDCATGALAYVNAGHNPPALRRVDGTIELLPTGGVPLGIQPETVHAAGSLTLQRGDRLVVYTDGVVEARNAAHEEYGESRLESLLRESQPAAAAGTLDRLFASIDDFVGDAVRLDDVTCLVLAYAGG